MHEWILIAAIMMGAPDVTESAAESVQIERLVADLHDDDERWNAYRAIDGLQEIGIAAVPALEDALRSDDWQQRQLAANVLIQIQGIKEKPSDQLLEVCIEALRDDGMPWSRDGNVMVKNGRAAAQLLGWHIDRSAQLLVECLDSEDYQQRFVAALILGAEGCQDHAEAVAKILLPHLRDNDMEDDAMEAAAALYQMGYVALPYLLIEMERTDEQAKHVIEDIIRDIIDPPTNRDERLARARAISARIDCGTYFSHVSLRRPYLLRWAYNLHDPAGDE